MVPDLIHVFPGLDDTSGDGVREVEDTSLLGGLVTDVLLLLVGASMADWVFGRPTIAGNTHWGASSPAKPAFIIPEPLSSTTTVFSSPPSTIFLDIFLVIPH